MTEPAGEKQRAEIIKAHLPLVKFIALKFAKKIGRRVDVDELIQYGSVGLLDAYEKFDPLRDNKFKTYAEFRIRGAILDGLRTEDVVPRSIRDLEKSVTIAAEVVQKKYKRTAATSEIAQQMGISVDEVHQIRTRITPVYQMPLDEADNFLPSDRKALLATATNKGHELEDKLMAIEKLERIVHGHNVIDRACFLLWNIWGLTMREIADLFQVSESRISQRVQNITEKAAERE